MLDNKGFVWYNTNIPRGVQENHYDTTNVRVMLFLLPTSLGCRQVDLIGLNISVDLLVRVWYTKRVKGVDTMKKKPRTAVEIYQSVRRDWGGVHPVTRVIPNKKKDKRAKHKKCSTELGD